MAFRFFKALLATPPWVTPSPREVLAPLQGFSAVSDGLSREGTPSFLKFLPFSLALPMWTRGTPRLLIPCGYDQIVTDQTDYPLRHSLSEPDRSMEVQAFAATDSLVKGPSHSTLLMYHDRGMPSRTFFILFSFPRKPCLERRSIVSYMCRQRTKRIPRTGSRFAE